MLAIFISYRRQETEAHAGRLYESLVRRMPGARIFMDVDGLLPGEDFVKRLDEALATAQVALVIIGPQWLTVVNETGQRRLNDEHDFVRREVAKALTSGLMVIPVLVGEAKVPSEDQLPSI